MNSLVGRVTSLLNQQNALLETALAVRTNPPEAPPTRIAVPVTDTRETEGNVANDTATVNDAMRIEINQWGSRVKTLIPIIVLILFKVLADNFVTGFVIIVCTTCFYRIKSAFDLELALKERSSKLNIAALLLGGVGLLFAIITEVKLLGYNDNVKQRLLFRYPVSESKTQFGFLNTLWICIVTDGIAQLLVLVMKVLVVNAVGLFFEVQKSGFKCFAGRFRFSGVEFSSLSQHDTDLEGGITSTSHASNSAATAFVATMSSLGLGTIGSGISSLVRRHSHSDHHNIPIATAVDSNNNSGGEHGGSTRDGQNSSDGSVVGRESKDFLIKVRACGLVDMLGLVYRTALPIPLWSAYFYLCPTVGQLLQVAYFAVKIYDLSWKAKGTAEAGLHFVTNKIEYGHYSTEEELRGQEEGACECPVCFDNPHTPVTLDCHHTFCEVCILEWLEKEQTCPVCRAKVEGCSALVEAVKAESAYTFPLFA